MTTKQKRSLEELIDESYKIIFESLNKKTQITILAEKLT